MPAPMDARTPGPDRLASERAIAEAPVATPSHEYQGEKKSTNASDTTRPPPRIVTAEMVSVETPGPTLRTEVGIGRAQGPRVA